MTLVPGTRLGPYEIISRIGAGGMGEVWRARDTRLERNVAIKILPGELAHDPHFRLRFEREAKTISKLNHPNICQIYDVGESAVAPSTTAPAGEVAGHTQVSYLVMELLEGESLADRLARGALPLPEVLRYGKQITEALAAAHRTGIVHRDLKPGNIMITKSGAKLLDFGLAKLSGAATDADAPTEQRKALTAEGTILGTFQYMAPEQLEGAEADVRSDIFALGAVLYEMATGNRAFQGTSRVSVIGSIMKDDPTPPSRSRPELPASFDQLVRIALEKAPDARWQSAHDVALHLGVISSAATGLMPPPLRQRRLATVLAGSLLLLAVLTAAAVIIIQRREGVGAQSLTQFELRPPDGATLYPFSGPVAISPNGRMIAFFAYTEGRYVLWIRNFDSLESRRVAAAGQGGSFPFWSPNSRFVGFVANGKMKAVDVVAGTAHTICEAPFLATGTWNRDGDIIFGGGSGSPILRVRSGGGKPAPVTKLDTARGELSQSWPYFLPDGRRFVYFSRSRDQELSGTYLGSLDSNVVTRLMSSESNAIYASPGYLVFASEGKLVAVPFDAASGEVRGQRRIIAGDVAGFHGSAGSLFSASDNGVLAYATAARARTELQWVSRNGHRLGTIADAGDCVHVAVSPDGQHVAFESIDPSNGNGTISIHERSRGVTSRLTPNAVWSLELVWSADGSEIFYSSFGPDGAGVYRSPRDGAAGGRLLIPAAKVLTWPTSQTSDGSQLLFATMSVATNSDLWVMPSAAPGMASQILNSDADEIQGQFSPDARWVAYTSNESGRLEVYVRPLTGAARKWKISSGGGSAPRWSRDGSELFFVSSEDTLMSARVKSGAAFEAAAPQALFDLKARHYFARYPYDVSVDGTFLVNRLLESAPSRIIIMSNWYAPHDD